MARIKLIFSVFGDLLNPEMFSKVSMKTATSYWLKGDRNLNHNNLMMKETSWEYSYGFKETLFLEEVSNLFIQDFSLSADRIASYINENSLESKVDLVVEIFNDEAPSMAFDKRFLELVVKMNGAIDIDLYHIKDNN